ncbi:hypothetical protein [Coraliomargarita parva]|uniref:hypothetical protein n=1 Tax=Coraliomargarita parva TaxID=3014050 RepID=UPI0022B5B3B0|nr:hypothetical protein [Coraliomargarita parva]
MSPSPKISLRNPAGEDFGPFHWKRIVEFFELGLIDDFFYLRATGEAAPIGELVKTLGVPPTIGINAILNGGAVDGAKSSKQELEALHQLGFPPVSVPIFAELAEHLTQRMALSEAALDAEDPNFKLSYAEFEALMAKSEVDVEPVADMPPAEADVSPEDLDREPEESEPEEVGAPDEVPEGVPDEVPEGVPEETLDTEAAALEDDDDMPDVIEDIPDYLSGPEETPPPAPAIAAFAGSDSEDGATEADQAEQEPEPAPEVTQPESAPAFDFESLADAAPSTPVEKPRYVQPKTEKPIIPLVVAVLALLLIAGAVAAFLIMGKGHEAGADTAVPVERVVPAQSVDPVVLEKVESPAESDTAVQTVVQTEAAVEDEPATNKVKGLFKDATGAISGAANKTVDFVKPAVKKTVEVVGDAVETATDAAADALKDSDESESVTTEADAVE